jgi:hypothetical protein
MDTSHRNLAEYLRGLSDAINICEDIKAEREKAMRHAASQRNYIEAAALMHKAHIAGQCAKAVKDFRDGKQSEDRLVRGRKA